MVALQEKRLTLLQTLLRQRQPLCIACSGGLDSRFLCLAACLANVDFLAIHVQGPHIPQRESHYALGFLTEKGIPHLTLTLNPLKIPEIAANQPRRCYFCKKFLFQSMKAQLRQKNLGQYLLCDGTNHDDLAEYRPGLAALKEEGIFSPLAYLQFDKNCLRDLARFIQLKDPDQAARPCLFTRFAYHETITAEQLHVIEACEHALETFFEQKNHSSIPNFRLRMTPTPLLQITPFPQNWRGSLRDILKQYQLVPCRLLVTEKISGFFDRTPEDKPLPLI